MKILVTPKTLWRLALAMWGLALCGAICCYFIPQSRTPSSTPPLIPLNTQKSLRTSHQLISLQTALQTRPFSLGRTDYAAKLPDLRTVILYYGCNGRPDLKSQHPRIQFGIRGTSTVACANADEKVFFRFDFRSNRWSTENKETPLSIVFKPYDTNVDVIVTLKNEKGNIKTPDEFHKFSLATTNMPVVHGATSSWTIGSFPVNPSILDRFGASWYGKDIIIQTLGGKEMENEAASERIDFNHNDTTYALFVQPNDYMAFVDDRWEKVSLGERSAGSPLLQVRNVDETSMTLHLWDSDGSHQLPVLLHKKTPISKFEIPAIRILGMRSPRSISVEILGKKFIISPHDWIIVSQNDLTVIDSEETLENFMQGQLKGNLLAFDGIEKVHHDQSLVGTFFDSTRTQAEPFAISMYRSWAKPDAAQNEDEESKDEDEEEDDDDLFEDDDEDEDDDEEHINK